jgi:hypothetical protein
MVDAPRRSGRGPVPREVPSVEFAEMVRLLAEGIADAQLALDRNSAALVEELASRRVEIVPEVREVVAADGSVVYEQADLREVSLLELGVTPTFYQLAESTIEVSMDVEIVEEAQESRAGRRRLGLRASTAGLRRERKLRRELTAHSKLTTTLVPVPMPAALEPTRATVAEDA